MIYNVILSNHSVIRAEERFSWNRDKLIENLDLAMKLGICSKSLLNIDPDIKKRINFYLDKAPLNKRDKTTIYIHNDVVFIIENNYLITIIHIIPDKNVNNYSNVNPFLNQKRYVNNNYSKRSKNKKV